MRVYFSKKNFLEKKKKVYRKVRFFLAYRSVLIQALPVFLRKISVAWLSLEDAIIRFCEERYRNVRRVVISRRLNLAGKFVFAPLALLGQKGVAIVLLISILLSNYALFDERAWAATYTFSQSSWAGGVSGDTLVHPTNQTGWTSYESETDAVVSATLSLDTSTSTVVQTNDGTTNTGFNLSGAAMSSTVVSGTGDSASVVLTSTSVMATTTGIDAFDGVILGGALQPSGSFPVLVYKKSSTAPNSVIVRTCNDAACTTSSSVTATSTVILNGIAAALGADGFPRIVFKNSLGKMYFMQCTNASCSANNETLVASDAATDPGGLSLTMASDGFARIAYLNNAGGSGMGFAQCTNASCSTSNITTIGAGDEYAAATAIGIAMGTDGYPRIGGSWFDGFGSTVVYFYQCTNASCSSKNTQVVTTVGLEYFQGIGVGSDGFARLAYIYNNAAYLIQCTNASCSTRNNNTTNVYSYVSSSDFAFGTDGFWRFTTARSSAPLHAFTIACADESCSSRATTTLASSYSSVPTSVIGLTSGNEAFGAYVTNTEFVFYGPVPTYESSGTYTSGSIDVGVEVSSWGELSWTNSGGQTITMKARSDADGDFSNATAWGSCSNITSGGALSTGGCVTDGHRYVQYQAALSTADTEESPSLDDVTISYARYAATGAVTGNVYDTTDPSNIMGGVSWTEDESLPSGTGVTVSVRTAATEGGLSGEPWTDLTNASANCSKVGGTVTCTSAALPSSMTTSGDNQYFQYKVTLTSSGPNTPTVSGVTVTYVVNATPEFEAAPTVVQNADGTVTITYSVRDPDTDTGTYTPGYVAPSFEYSLDNGSTWSGVSTSTLAATDDDPKAVQTSAYTQYSATWDVTAQFTGQYDTDAKIRVTVDDSELANNTVSSTSAAFTLDTKEPEFGAIPMIIDASQATPLVTFDVTDDLALEMKVGVMPDLSDGAYEAYNASYALALSSGDTVYAQFRDAKGNETAIISQMPLSAPGDMFYQDTSNAETMEWREFFAWGVADEPAAGFAQYNVHRSVNGGAYASLTTITNRLVNYVVDNDLDTGSSYRYKVSIQDDHGNISFFSDPTDADQPDGVGGTDLAAPTISGVSVSGVNTTGATITWTTNKLSDSIVFYVASTTYPGSDAVSYDDTTGVPSMVDSHTVNLSGLTPSTQYYFMVESADSSDNTRQNASAAFTFTTNEGPVISNVTTAEVFDNEATITWNTNIPADSTVYYSINNDMSAPTEVSGSAALSTNHSVTLTGLTEGTRYYYYVQSTDAENNEATDKNVISGTIYYHSFNTSSDEASPTISNVGASLVGERGVTITWTTDEPTTSQIEWGDTTGLGTYTDETSVYTRQHAVVLTGLTSEVMYYYRVISRDKSENMTDDDNGGSTYSFTTLSPTTVVVSSSGGSGGSGRDRTAPSITNIKVSSLSGTASVVTYQTSEAANEQIDYGETTAYGETESNLTDYRASHVLYLNDLKPGATYHFSITASDVVGNTRSSGDLTFVAGQDAGAVDVPSEESTDSLESILMSASEAQLASVISSMSLKAALSPLIYGVDVTAKVESRRATIEWATDKVSSSLVAYSKASDYRPGQPYSITVGYPDERTTAHKVVLENLEPSTTYHFQVISKGYLGTIAQSNDGTFTTTSLVPDITDTRLIEATGDSATIEWQTALPSRSVIEVTNTNTGEVYEVEDPSYIEEHTYTIENLDDSATYAVKLTAIDSDGNASDPVTLPLSTSYTPGAPVISDLKISTSIIPDRIETTQTIISWKTNKVSNSRVRFAEGSTTELTEETPLDPALTRDHVVITTTLLPGAIYTIVAESGSGRGETAQSEPYTIITPQPRASVVDLIFENLDTTFGFLKGER